MPQRQITWPGDDRITFHGRTGTGECAGLWITPMDLYVTLRPLTSKGKLANCSIDVPLEQIPALIDALHAVHGRRVVRKV